MAWSWFVSLRTGNDRVCSSRSQRPLIDSPCRESIYTNHTMKHSLPCILASLCLSVPVLALAAEFTAENDTLRVKYNDGTHAFSVSDLTTGETFLRDGMLDGGGIKAVTQPAADGVFGNGQKLVVTQADGSVVVLALYQKLPFLLITKEVKNGGPTELDVQKAVPAVFTLDLGKPANELHTMGTGGLLPADTNPGSYFFLAVRRSGNPPRGGRRLAHPGSRQRHRLLQHQGRQGRVQGATRARPPASCSPVSRRNSTLSPSATSRCPARPGAVRRRRQEPIPHQAAPTGGHLLLVVCRRPGHGGAGTPTTTVELSQFIARELKPYGLGVIQIDDGWQDGPQIGGPGTEFDRVSTLTSLPRRHRAGGQRTGQGRHHLRPLVAAVRSQPHAAATTRTARTGSSNEPDGKPLRQHSFGGTCLDCTHPEVQEHLKITGQNHARLGRHLLQDGRPLDRRRG